MDVEDCSDRSAWDVGDQEEGSKDAQRRPDTVGGGHAVHESTRPDRENISVDSLVDGNLAIVQVSECLASRGDQNQNIQDGVFDYYRSLYNRRFNEDKTDEPTAYVEFESTSLHSDRRCAMSRTCTGRVSELQSEAVCRQAREFYPRAGQAIYFRPNPAMNKGVAVFTSSFWSPGHLGPGVSVICGGLGQNLTRMNGQRPSSSVLLMKDYGTRADGASLSIMVKCNTLYTYSHTVVRHFTRAEELDDKLGVIFTRELAYDTFVDCAGLCFQNKTCHSFSFYSGACYIRNTYDVHTGITYLGSPGMKTFLKKAECVSPYSQVGDACMWVSSSALANDASRSKCQMDGGDLVTLPSFDKIQLVEAFMVANGFQVNTRRSVGAYLDVASLKWNWLDGSALNTSNWCEPNNPIQTSELCLQMGNSCWMDRPCTHPYEYICEIRL